MRIISLINLLTISIFLCISIVLGATCDSSTGLCTDSVMCKFTNGGDGIKTCYSISGITGLSCTGVDYCVINVTAPRSTIVRWASSCGNWTENMFINNLDHNITLRCNTSASICGNGIVEYGESCDDGNILDYDYCSSNCQCKDSDNGMFLARRGTTTVRPFTARDICLNEAKIREYFCTSEGIRQINITCPDGLCFDGECQGATKVQESITCLFNNSNISQRCLSTDGRYGCTASFNCRNPDPTTHCTIANSCTIRINEGFGKRINWTSSCAGSASTITDKRDDIISFNCNEYQNLLCGNNLVDAGEVCDDGNNIDSDGCSSDCRCSDNDGGIVLSIKGKVNNGADDFNDNCINSTILQEFYCSGSAILSRNILCNSSCSQGKCNGIGNICGNGVIETGEECDDGNNINNDSCRNNCKPPKCYDTDGSNLLTLGNVYAFQYSEWVNRTDICYSLTTVAEWTCDKNDNAVQQLFPCNGQCRNGTCVNSTSRCGNNMVELPERCDDGNTNNNDGCLDNCSTANLCYDNDGDNSLIQGQVFINNLPSGNDYCINSSWVMEYSCYRGQIITSQINCEVECSNGSCVTGSQTRSLTNCNVVNSASFGMWGPWVVTTQTARVVVGDYVQFTSTYGNPSFTYDCGENAILERTTTYGTFYCTFLTPGTHIVSIQNGSQTLACKSFIVTGDATCYDGDFGINTNISSSAILLINGVEIRRITDTCLNSITVRESYCNGNSLLTTDLTCTGYCQDGMCKSNPVCGDGIVDTYEECDDGNLDNNDACSNGCLVQSASEELLCIFANNSNGIQRCYTNDIKYQCSGLNNCSIPVKEPFGSTLSWSSSCGGRKTTIVEGSKSIISFDCSARIVSEIVSCQFIGSTKEENCSSDREYSCKAKTTCKNTVIGASGDIITWVSSCGGYYTTTLDGRSESIAFNCNTTNKNDNRNQNNNVIGQATLISRDSSSERLCIEGEYIVRNYYSGHFFSAMKCINGKWSKM